MDFTVEFTDQGLPVAAQKVDQIDDEPKNGSWNAEKPFVLSNVEA